MATTRFTPAGGDAHPDYYRTGFIASAIGHIVLFAAVVFRFQGWGDFSPPVVYSVTIEGGSKIGGMSQVPKDDKKSAVAPPKNVKSEPKAEKKVEEKKAEVKEEKKEVPEDTKNTVKIPDKKAEKEKPKKEVKTKAKEETPEEINKRLQSAMQRYLGESSNAGGTGFGAAALGGKGMGGGVVRPPEFFIYAKKLEEYIKSGWVWNDTSAALISQVTFEIAPDGRLGAIQLTKGSGTSAYDDSVLRAVTKASPVPPPPASVYEYFRSVRMTFDPRE